MHSIESGSVDWSSTADSTMLYCTYWLVSLSIFGYSSLETYVQLANGSG
jgi:hypothetical protein